MTLTTLGPDRIEMKKFINSLSYLPHAIQVSREKKAKKILKIIEDNNAIIAGGAVTNTLIPNPTIIKDIDIYVNVSNSQKLLNSLLSDQDIMDTYLLANHTAPVYDKSFMLRNNILGRIAFMYEGESKIEVMIVKDDFSLEQVVDNFDLTFCKAWMDGKNIYTRYMDDIKNLTGQLGIDYLKAYLEGNTFTSKRLDKYIERGFTIKYPNINTSDIKFKKYKKKVISEEEWAVYFILKNLISFVGSSMYSNKFYISFDAYVLEELTSVNPNKVYNLEGVKKIITNVYQPLFDDNFTLNTAIYGLIMYEKKKYLELCEWCDTKNLKYFEKIGIKILPNDDGPSHGFNNEPWDFCTRNSYIEDKLTKIDMYYLYELFEKNYQDLDIGLRKPERPLTAAQRFANQQELMRAAAARFAELNEDYEIEENEEEMYKTPSGREVPARCFNITDGGNINTSNWANKEGNILLLVETAPGLDPDLVCTDINELEHALTENTGILYRCGGTRGNMVGSDTIVDDVATLGDVPYDLSMINIDTSTKYIPFIYDLDGNTAVKGYLPKEDMKIILAMAKGNTNLPVVVLNFVDTISHTISKDVMEGGGWPDSNHCQAGSTIVVFKLQRTDDMVIYEQNSVTSDIDSDISDDFIDMEMECPLVFEVDIIPQEDVYIQRPPPSSFNYAVDAAEYILGLIEFNTDENIIETKVYFGNGTEVPSFIRREILNVFVSVDQPLEGLLEPILTTACMLYQYNIHMFQEYADNRKMLSLDIYLEDYSAIIRVNLYD